MSPYLLLGFLVAGLLHAFVPRTIYRQHLSKRSFASVVWATLLGIPLPLCSCGVIPTAMSLSKSGASKGATVAFLISTPQTGVDSILATASMLGWPYAVMRPLVALVTALIGGEAANILSAKEDAQSDNDTTIAPPKGLWAKCRLALRYGFVDMVQDIGKWLIMGLLIAALITLFVPDGFFTMLSDYPLLNMVAVLAISIPMYVCSTGSIPIAAALILKGLSPGAALVLLMAGPATNMATILVVRKVLGMRTLLIYLASIIFGAIGFGLLIDLALPHEWFVGGITNAIACDACSAPVWWKIASAIVLGALLVNALIQRLLKRTKSESVAITITVQGMRCNHCKANVERAVAALEGVESCEADITKGVVNVVGTTERKSIEAAIEQLGFTVVKE